MKYGGFDNTRISRQFAVTRFEVKAEFSKFGYQASRVSWLQDHLVRECLGDMIMGLQTDV